MSYGNFWFNDFQFKTVDLIINNYGIDGKGADWFRSYLSRRMRHVSVNGTDSDPLQISSGVPSQGSILRPILFPSYDNDTQFMSKLIRLCYMLMT